MINAYTDGACRLGNPGICSCAWVLSEGAVKSRGYYLGPERHTNNYAEYQGVIKLLEYLYTNAIRNVVIHCDSTLVVNQVNQKWEINSDELRPLMSKAYGLLVHGAHVLKHVKGHDGIEGNEAADRVCNAVLDLHTEEYEKQN